MEKERLMQILRRQIERLVRQNMQILRKRELSFIVVAKDN
jgi:hypothetical protein